jgi:hypothetical protein
MNTLRWWRDQAHDAAFLVVEAFWDLVCSMGDHGPSSRGWGLVGEVSQMGRRHPLVKHGDFQDVARKSGMVMYTLQQLCAAIHIGQRLRNDHVQHVFKCVMTAHATSYL